MGAQILKYLLEKWDEESRVIAGAPLAFLVALLLSIALVYFVVRWRYQGIVDTLEQRIKLKDDQLAELKEKTSDKATGKQAENGLAWLFRSPPKPVDASTSVRFTLLGDLYDAPFSFKKHEATGKEDTCESERLVLRIEALKNLKNTSITVTLLGGDIGEVGPMKVEGAFTGSVPRSTKHDLVIQDREFVKYLSGHKEKLNLIDHEVRVRVDQSITLLPDLRHPIHAMSNKGYRITVVVLHDEGPDECNFLLDTYEEDRARSRVSNGCGSLYVSDGFDMKLLAD